MSKKRFRKENACFVFVLSMLETEKQKKKKNKMEKGKKPINTVFLRRSSKMRKFKKKGFLAKIA